MALASHTSQYSHLHAQPELHEVVLTPLTPDHFPQQPQYVYGQRSLSDRVVQARQRAALHRQRLAWVGSLCFSVFLVFGLFQVSRALLENTTDIFKLQREAATVAQVNTYAQHQQQNLDDAIGYYASAEGTEAMIRDYLNAVGPNEILVSLESL